jgi:hypothetical protein
LLDQRINGEDLTAVILRAKTKEKSHLISTRRNSEIFNSVSSVQIKNPLNGETFQDRLGWAIAIQNIQSDLGLQRTAFPDLCLEGDYVFCYDLSKQMELEDLDNELWLNEYKKKRRAHIQEIVDASMLSEQEKEWMKEYASQSAKDITYGKENRHVKRS